MNDTAQYTGVERRRSPRVASGIKARMFAKDATSDVAILNVSFHGVLLDTPNLMEIGETLTLTMHVSTDPGPLDLTGRVVRVVTVCSALGFRSFNIGIEFLNMHHDQKEKLSQAVYCLFKEKGG